jgi:GAF domain-containing protein
VTGLSAGFNSDYSALAVPLRIGEQPLGVITIAHRTSGRYGHEAQAMTTTFASYAAVAIENARLYDTAQEQAYASAALLQVAQAIVSLNDLDEILGTIIRIMPILVGIERAVFINGMRVRRSSPHAGIWSERRGRKQFDSHICPANLPFWILPRRTRTSSLPARRKA